MWFFFRYLGPALVFGRAARSSWQISGYGVFPAADELRHVGRKEGDERHLYVPRPGSVSSLDRGPDEANAFRRWIAGVDGASADWSPPERMCVG